MKKKLKFENNIIVFIYNKIRTRENKIAIKFRKVLINIIIV